MERYDETDEVEKIGRIRFRIEVTLERKETIMKRKKICLTVLLIMCVAAFCACGKGEEGNSGLTALTPTGTETEKAPDASQIEKEDGWDVEAILAEGYYNKEYKEYFVGGISFALDAATKTARATGTYIADTTEYYMPDSIQHEDVIYPVTGAEEGVFTGGDATKIRLSHNLTEISEAMFYGCEALTELVIPEGVTVIGDNAFTTCSSLRTVTLPSTLSKIGSEAFFGCTSLQKLVLPEGVTEIGASAFYECSLLKEIIFPKSLKKIPDEALNNCVCLETVTIPEGVSQIGYEVFWGCTALKSITIPDSVVLMGTRMFYDCTALEEVTLPANLLEVDTEMFAFCESLKKVYASASVAELVQESMPMAEFEVVVK